MRAAHHAKKGPPNITNNIFMCGEAYRLYMSGGRFHQIHLKVSCNCKMRCIKIEMKPNLIVSNDISKSIKDISGTLLFGYMNIQYSTFFKPVHFEHNKEI